MDETSQAAEPLERLLAVQERDLALDRIAVRRRDLPERARLATVEGELARLDETSSATRAGRDGLAGEQDRLEQEVAGIVARIHEIERRMYGGEVSASRELSAMAEEVQSLQRRRSQLEDRVVGLMEQVEPLDAELVLQQASRDRLEADAGQIRDAIAAAEEELDAEAEVERSARKELAAALPPDLARRYETIRARLGGIGAARLAGSSCTGCHLTLPAMELQRLRRLPPGEVSTCDQCGRILVP